ncbi:methyltransferase [Diaphorobacter nitroreducens]|uniref:class I SAM-dependent methyltransferase n=1 Tax=Diaphorobacter nitroreducens TaxID=164759 RepID=UPI000DC73616|nr:class I SAM-dependent methyltransferase [Diaphorobacter nitroreducens]ASI68618.1 methyltransferase [Diaphorobacter nitroreducens]
MPDATLESSSAANVTPMLCGVPQTMLWTLYNRATESLRTDAWFRDPDAERIFRSITFDYRAYFGRPDSSHATRSQMFDEALRPWIAAHPGGTVVELGCGLETQFQRCDDGHVRWLCVDVPDAIAVRERYIRPSERSRHLALSALDLRWMDEVDATQGVFITAQGLFMYFPEDEVRSLVLAMTERFEGGELMFDTIPRWFSRKTMTGFDLTRHYRAPPMPWGINRDEIETTLRAWSPRIVSVKNEPYRRFRTFPARLGPWMACIPALAKLLPAIVRVRLTGK